jgi:hypothetical protein
MQIRGYSERGMINALFYGMMFSTNRNFLFSKLLKLIKPRINFSKIESIKVYIEPSLSEYGTSDCIVSFEANNRNNVMFLEAKIKGWHYKKWNFEPKVYKQLESKMKLFLRRRKAIRDLNKTSPKIGHHLVVVNNIFKEIIVNADRAYCVALLPEKPKMIMNAKFKLSGYILWKDLRNEFKNKIKYLEENFIFNEAKDQKGLVKSQIY